VSCALYVWHSCHLDQTSALLAPEGNEPSGNESSTDVIQMELNNTNGSAKHNELRPANSNHSDVTAVESIGEVSDQSPSLHAALWLRIASLSQGPCVSHREKVTPLFNAASPSDGTWQNSAYTGNQTRKR